MRLLFLYVAVSLSIKSFSQFDSTPKSISSGMGLPASQSLKVPANSNFDFNKVPPEKSTYSNWDTPTAKTVNIVQKDEFVNPGEAIKDKLNKELSAGETSKGDQYLGEFRNNGKFVKLVCRDFADVDGDRVRIYHNGAVVEKDVFLDSFFKTVEIYLFEGSNIIDIEALNQGTGGPNTGEFKIFDEKGVLISSNQWNLGTGHKGSLLIIKGI